MYNKRDYSGSHTGNSLHLRLCALPLFPGRTLNLEAAFEDRRPQNQHSSPPKLLLSHRKPPGKRCSSLVGVPRIQHLKPPQQNEPRNGSQKPPILPYCANQCAPEFARLKLSASTRLLVLALCGQMLAPCGANPPTYTGLAKKKN